MKKFTYKYWYVMSTGHGIEEIVSETKPTDSEVMEKVLAKRGMMALKKDSIPEIKLILVENI